jgi:putative transcriptional regulator
MAEIVSNNVRAHREKKGITQQELADAVSVSRQTVIAIEKGNYTPSVGLALKLATYFTTSVETLFTL